MKEIGQINQKSEVIKKVMRVKSIYDKKILSAIKITGGVILTGPAGVGKTSSLEHIAREEGWETVFYQCHPQTDGGELLYQLIPDDSSKSGIKKVDGALIKALRSAKEGRDTILILDEWDKTRPSMDAFLLDFIQSKRISVPGMELKLEDGEGKLYIALTSNDMRELSEPLLRRLPVIKMEHLPPSLVREALRLSHPDSLYIEPAVRLYVMTIKAGLEKPATIQELRQLLSAIEEQGDEADWDELVRIYVTKTEENHLRLKEIERRFRGVPIEWEERRNDTLDPTAYEEPVEEEKEEKKEDYPRLPRPRVVEKRDPAPPTEEELEKSTIVALASEDNLTATVKACDFNIEKIKVKDSFVIANPKLRIKTRKDIDTVSSKIKEFDANAEVEVAVLRTCSVKETVKFIMENVSANVKKIVKGGVVLVRDEAEIYVDSKRKYMYVVGKPKSVDFVIRALEHYFPKNTNTQKQEETEPQALTLTEAVKRDAFDSYTIKNENLQVTLDDVKSTKEIRKEIEKQVKKKVDEIEKLPPLKRMEEIYSCYDMGTGASVWAYNHPLITNDEGFPTYNIRKWQEKFREYICYFVMFAFTEELSKKDIITVKVKESSLDKFAHKFDTEKGLVEFRICKNSQEIETIAEAKEAIWEAIEKIASHIRWLLEGEK